jgi:PadR family transcriptional regulator, regulatory protein AphA
MERNRTAYVALGMLSIQPNLSGYDIRKAVEGSVGHFWGESYGQIYPTLKRLAAEGLIVANSAPSSSRKKRQEYSLTEAGRTCLGEWLAVPFQNDPPRNEFLLKLFFGGDVPLSVSIAHVRDCQEKNRQMLATLKEFEELMRKQASPNPHAPFWTLTLELGIALTRTGLEWCDHALATLLSMQSEEAIAKRHNENFAATSK